MRNLLVKRLLLIILLISSVYLYGQIGTLETKNLLYLNSYNVTYSWGDSVSAGIQNVFAKHREFHLYFEYLDVKRFGKVNFEDKCRLLKNKYRDLRFDGIILSDNGAVDFMLEYGDSIAPGVPVAFCGINNPEDYDFSGTNYFGIKEGVDQDSVIRLIFRVIPNIRKLYFIADNTTTSLVNMNYIRELEPRYTNKVQFIYISDISIDSLYKLAPGLEKGNAVALMDIFQDIDQTPVNSDIVLQEFASLSSVPIFMDSETSFGKGILGGIINSGFEHGTDVAELIIRMVNNPNYIPSNRILNTKDNYYFDYAVAKKYNIDPTRFPPKSHIINLPTSFFIRYKHYLLGFSGIVLFLLLVISFLIVNNTRRRKAEDTVKQKLVEIQEKNEELKLAHAKADESNRLKSAFLANLSHEIRTPLNAIVGFSNLLEEALKINDRKRFTKLIINNSEQLLRLINDLLDLSKVETGELVINRELTDINDLLRDLIDSFNQASVNPKVRIQMNDSVKDKSLVLNTDSSRLRQILSNLLSNAIKFTEKGYIELGYRDEDTDNVILYVKDTGIGIREEYHEKIFSRFWKVEEDKTRIYPGTGLGLAISRRLTEALGGNIAVDSKIGEGSVFSIFLPNSSGIKSSVIGYKRKMNSSSDKIPEGLTIAIAEDNEPNLEYLLEILNKQKPTILTFHNGKEIVDYFSNYPEKVDIILMDIKMPLMTGFEASNAIKSMYPTIPIIAQTAYAMKEDIAKIGQSEIDDYVVKPINPDQLIQKINQNLRF